MSEGEWTASGYTVFEVDTALLAVGSNVLAAEIHQSSLDSSDLGFDLKLVGEVTVAE